MPQPKGGIKNQLFSRKDAKAQRTAELGRWRAQTAFLLPFFFLNARGMEQNFFTAKITKSVSAAFPKMSITVQPNRYFILYKRASRFVKVAYMLHLTAIFGLAKFLGFGMLSVSAFETGSGHLFYIYGYFSLFGIVLTFFAQMDAYSRLQNYKLAKDLFFERGFQKRIANLFVRSHCQREAIKIAAIDLGILDEINSYYESMGYRWFHLIPDIVFHNHKVLLTRYFWKRTLFATPYKSKYFQW